MVQVKALPAAKAEEEYRAWCEDARECYDEPIAILSDRGLVTAEMDWTARFEARRVHVQPVSERAFGKFILQPSTLNLGPRPSTLILSIDSMAHAYKTFTDKKPLTPEARKEAFGLLLQRSADTNALSKATLQHLERADAEELLNLYTAPTQPVLFEQR